MQPSQPIDWTRRDFLQGSLTLVSAAATIPFWVHAGSRVLAAQDGANPNQPGVPSDRILVVVQLSGGNDGLNTVIPFGEHTYYRLRPQIAIAADQVIDLGQRSGIGLHPSLRSLHEMMGQGQAAILQGVGYPNPNRSHFASMDIWHRGDSLSERGYGWLGKAMDTRHDRPDQEGMDMVALTPEAPLAMQGVNAQPVALGHESQFQWLPRTHQPVLAAYHDDLIGSEAVDSACPASLLLQRTALDAQLASDRIRAAVRQAPLSNFPGHGLARDLQRVAAMIRAELPVRIYYVAMGGFDTHAAQPGRHANLLTQFAQSMQAFYRELAASGDAQRVVSFAFSEFGRRVAQNGSQGTDHGAAGPAFVFGPAVTPGLLGQHPSMMQLQEGDLAHTLDFRNVYATLLRHWMQLDDRAVLGHRYQPINLIQSSLRRG